MSRAHVSINGLVQGVFFRASTRDKAQKLGVKGWVKNCSDGSVEALFEGEKNFVDEIVSWCRRGPDGAFVSTVKEKTEKYTGEFDDFSIVY